MGILPTFHVGLVVKIGHLPAVLFFVVVVSVGGMMRRSDRLGVRGRSSVVKIGLASRRIGRHYTGGSSRFGLAIAATGRSGADHPNEQNQKDQKHDET